MAESIDKATKDHPLLQEIAQLASERDVLADPRWEALAAGKLGPVEVEALREWADRVPAARAAFEAMQPVGDAELDSMTEAALQATKRRPQTDVDPSLAPRKRRALLVALGGAVALAAAALLTFRANDPLPLGEYELVLGSGDKTHRSASADDSLQFGPGSHFELIARPRESVWGPLATRAAVVHDGRGEAWAPPIHITEDGTVQIQGSREAIFPGISDGEVEIWLAIARPDALPAKLPPDTSEASNDALVILRARVFLAPATP